MACQEAGVCEHAGGIGEKRGCKQTVVFLMGGIGIGRGWISRGLPCRVLQSGRGTLAGHLPDSHAAVVLATPPALTGLQQARTHRGRMKRVALSAMGRVFK